MEGAARSRPMSRCQTGRRAFVSMTVAPPVAMLLVLACLTAPVYAAGSYPPCGPGCSDPAPSGDSFVGSAALFTPDGRVVSPSRAPAGCSDCVWTQEILCLAQQPSPGCVQVLGYCPKWGDTRAIPYTITLTRAGLVVYTTTVCLRRGDKMLTVDDVGEAAKQNWVAYVPEQHVSMQPPDGAIVELPTIFDSGQPRQMPMTKVHVFGFDVMVTAAATWTWTFAPGHTMVTQVPGSRYPDTTVSYTYAESGTHSVSLRTSWKGRFSVGEYGPYDINDPATQGPVRLVFDVTGLHPVLTG